jgi:hypothetical protein
MGNLFCCIDAAPFRRLQPRSTVARVRDRTVTVAVVGGLAISTFIAVAALAGPLSRSIARAETRTQFAYAVDLDVRAGNATEEIAVRDGRRPGW